MPGSSEGLALNLRLVEFWVLFCTALVLFMQAGFCCLESGLSRSKNSIDVAVKNLIDFCVAGCLFWVCGYALMFGPSHSGIVGTEGFFFTDPSPGHWPTVFFLFQLVYCGTSITIASGAVAERMRLIPYLVLAVVVAVLIYPLFGHWVWAGLEGDPGTVPLPVGWLAKLGFVDFAGSTVVHSLGAWVALAAVVAVGPRSGRFPEGQPARRIQGHNLPMATLGLFILWLGWFGFNGGRTFAPNEQVPLILVNTLLAGAFGGISGLLFPWLWHTLIADRFRQTTEGFRTSTRPIASPPLRFSVEETMNGVLAGLVAISASCNVTNPPAAATIGGSAAIVMYFSSRLLERGIWRFCGKWVRVDDVVGAIPAHGFAGAWGTLAVALFTPDATWTIQLLGIVVCFAWSFGIGFVALGILNRLSVRFPSLRLGLTVDEEKEGLNYVEYKATTEFYELLSMIQDHLRGASTRADEAEPVNEIGMIARLYNQVVKKQVELEQAHRESEFQMALQNAAQQANESKSEFLALMSHEIRTPMTAVIGFTNVLMDQMTNPAHRENLETIKRNGAHLLTLIDDILDLSKIEAGKLDIEVSQFSLVELIEEIRKLMRIRCEGTGVTLQTEFAGTLPDLVTTDRMRLRQIIINLTSNAIKFTDTGTVRLVSRMVADSVTPLLQISVIDTGVGMSPETIGRLFQPFTQAQRRNAHETSGTGLGLTISKRLVEMLHGDINVSSTPGQGSTFTITIPCAESESAPVSAVDERATMHPAHAEPARLGKVRLDGNILLVEDGFDNQRLITHLLEHAGAMVTVAEDGQAAVEAALHAAFGQHPFDLILMDMRMPQLDGYQATRQLRSAGYASPIIALTAHAMKGDREKCLAAGCNDFATKPIAEQQLLAQIDRWLHKQFAMPAKDGSIHSALAEHATVGEIIGEFVQGVGKHAARLQQLLAERDWNGLYEYAHQLKGSFGNYGFHQLTPSIQQLLDAIRERKGETEIAAAVQRVIELSGRICSGPASEKED